MDESHEIRIIRLMTWLPGRLWAKVNPHTDDSLGVLMSTDGPLHNVIKIKPPLEFDKANVDF